ncbi:D-amino acid dehydrogenase [Nitratireductor sp. GISD-1A_MAKvit]|uniref:D-amino acid dehydrogenase n=1 Tax=Nitratireductor sp. GISD-1A_MAKvit TaxID=3234198 RepID=UPI0034662668
MRIIVIGAGVVGTTSAWYLLKDGHDVTVVERNAHSAMETSYANAGGICPGFAGPWAAPGMPWKALRWLFQDSAPLKVRPRFDPAQWKWLAQFTANCTRSRFAQNKARMQAMAHYSKRCLTELVEETGIEYDAAHKGILHLFTTDAEMTIGHASSRVLTEMGIEHRLLQPSEIVQIEPALGLRSQTFSGGIHLTTDETGDCRLFTQALAILAEQRGARFLYNTDATRLLIKNGRIHGLETPQETLEADAYVVAAGPFSRSLLASAGLSAPIYPVKGYSLTCTISDNQAAPVSCVMDEHSKVMITRLGSRLRAAGMAELAGFDPTPTPSARRLLLERVKTLFPNASDYDKAEWWCGFRPMTPDGPARLGQSVIDNLFINIGHGSNGWTQACGTSRVLADLMAGRTPQVSA